MSAPVSLREFTAAEQAAIEAAAIPPLVIHDALLAEFRAADPDCLPGYDADDTGIYDLALVDAQQAIVAEVLDTTPAPAEEASKR
jgi:hypothetical protein